MIGLDLEPCSFGEEHELDAYMVATVTEVRREIQRFDDSADQPILGEVRRFATNLADPVRDIGPRRRNLAPNP